MTWKPPATATVAAPGATLKVYAGTYLSPSGAKVEVAFQPGKGLSVRGAGGFEETRIEGSRVPAGRRRGADARSRAASPVREPG